MSSYQTKRLDIRQATGLPVIRFLPIVLLFVLTGPHRSAHATEPSIDYRLQVRTILGKHCWACHGALKQEAGLRLDASQLIRKGSDDGPVIVAGRPDRSRLWQKVTAKCAKSRQTPTPFSYAANAVVTEVLVPNAYSKWL